MYRFPLSTTLTDGRGYTAAVVGTDPDLDVAILAISARDLTAVNLMNSDKLRVGVAVARDGRSKHISVLIDAPLAYGCSANLHPLLEGKL